MDRPTVFISYSRKDEKWKNLLTEQLSVLAGQGLLTVWDDSRIAVGDTWRTEIEQAMTRARVAILLISSNFLNSDFILKKEVPRLLQRHSAEGVRIVPLITRPCPWSKVDWLARLQCRPQGARPLSSFDEHEIEQHLTDLVTEVYDLLLEAPSPKKPTLATDEPLSSVQPSRESSKSWRGAMVDVVTVIITAMLAVVVHWPSNPAIDLKMIFIPGGEFTMGVPDNKAITDDDDEGPPHRVTVAPFEIGKYEVTQAQWKAIMDSNPIDCTNYDCYPDLPVHSVTWHQTTEFLNKLTEYENSKRGADEQITPCYSKHGDETVIWEHGCTGYRLPTEAEWEYAARAGKTTHYSFGDDDKDLDRYAWYGGNSGGKVHPVGEKAPNPWGLHDVHGNVWEWCWDWWTRSYDPDAKGEKGRVIRGGAFGNTDIAVRSTSRDKLRPSYPGGRKFLGLRVARTTGTHR